MGYKEQDQKDIGDEAGKKELSSAGSADTDKEFLRTEPLGKLLLRLALPTVTAQLINMLYNIVDRIYIGHIPNIGATALTGVGVCMPLIMIVSAFAALVGYGGAPRASIFMGKQDKESAEKTLGNCFVLQIIISIILTVVLLIWNRDFLMAFGASRKTIEYGVDYMNIYALGTIFVEITLGMNAFITPPGFHIRISHGCEMSRPGNDHFPGAFLYLGGKFSVRKEDVPENKEKESGAYAKDHTSLSGAGSCDFYHAGKRKRDFRML